MRLRILDSVLGTYLVCLVISDGWLIRSITFGHNSSLLPAVNRCVAYNLPFGIMRVLRRGESTYEDIGR